MLIFHHLEDTRPFAATCRQFYAISRDVTCESSWIVHRYGPRLAIYYALLTRPERCLPDFLYTLFRTGALLPTCLTQALVQNYGKRTHLFFANQIQRLPFTGYAYLMERSHPTLDVWADENKAFATALVDGNTQQWQAQLDAGFFPLLITRPILKLAQVDPVRFQTIAPLFSFDPEARAALWQAVFALLLDEAFRKSPVTPERHRLLLTVQSVMTRPDTEPFFCKAFVEFLTKYPRGYCDPATTARIIHLLITFIHPVGFSLSHALRSIKNLRPDLQENLNKALLHL
ncbi:hypothetical protein BY458DRAFT_445850 [Sporodiniella umbellata]|nr:hypothetical protein BY458DRAFT_445850 [Sporodiniella umbellata]